MNERTLTANVSPPSAKVEIYTWRYCAFCARAKLLLEAKGVDFIEHAIDGDEAARESMTERAKGRRTLPQIFINDQAIGGFQDLAQLERDGLLDECLSEAYGDN